MLSAAAHPRSRGENSHPSRHRRWKKGSSPLTRGKRTQKPTWSRRTRLIPAHAGKTPKTPHENTPETAHPRSRGENTIPSLTNLALTGSSPLTRGKRNAGRLATSARRLIPAHAGKTSGILSRRSTQRAHPRSRGENGGDVADAAGCGGSSPLTRGKRPGLSRGTFPRRLIPAHAGKTVRRYTAPSGRAAHPRSRGENRGVGIWLRGGRGSSPLTRGKHSLTCAFIKRIGQILESLELCASSGNYSLMDAYATDAPQDQARNTGLAPPSSRAAS